MPLPFHRAVLGCSVFLAVTLAGCTTYDREFYVGHDRLTIARVQRDDGSVETYELDVGQGRPDASLTLRTEYERDRAFLGLRVAEIDKAAAERRGVEPYRGLLVTSTFPRSAAVEAGIVAGDIVLAVGAEPVVYREQLERVEATLRADQPLAVRLLRGREEIERSVTPHALHERVVEPQAIELDTTPGRRPYAGVVLRGIPAIWCKRMFGDDRNAVAIASVDVGSPAWSAGIRAGDLIERVDGSPVGTVDELAQLFYTRGQAGGSVELQVRRGLDEQFAAPIALDDYSVARQVWFPLLFRVRDGAREDEWTIGPFGLLASNTNTYVADPPGRESPTANTFDALLGLVHVETGGPRRTVRLLWFITITV